MAHNAPPTNLDVGAIANTWLKNLNDALNAADVDAFVACIEPQGFLRDLMTFTWAYKSRHGRDEIRSYLSNTLVQAQLSNVTFDDNLHGKPRLSMLPTGQQTIEAALKFETPKALGGGHVRLTLSKDGGPPKAFILMLMLSDWKGHEEPGHELTVVGKHEKTWADVLADKRAEIESDPYVLIVGAGHAGLQVAARFRQMGIKALLIERTAHIGDVWRNRYSNLTLHTPRAQNQLLYAPFPSNWPKWIPKDKMADWFEQYAQSQDLVYWTSTSLEPTPIYNKDTKRWDVTVIRDGTPLQLRPAHIVMSVGPFGDPILSTVAGSDVFAGTILHTGEYREAAPFAGKRVVVVGACNSAADICQDLTLHGAASVTMVQRSATVVISLSLYAALLDPVFVDGRPAYYNDLGFLGLPFEVVLGIGKQSRPFREQFDKEMTDGLKAAGFKLSPGPDGAGSVPLTFSRGGGYFIDVGAADLISNGRIKVKQGTEIERLTPTSVIFKDGSELDADAVILSTGWGSVREKMRSMFGDKVIDAVPEVWGLDAEGEPEGGGFKPTGHPGLWFAAGDITRGRFLSKQLGLFIKATELGYYNQEIEGSP